MMTRTVALVMVCAVLGACGGGGGAGGGGNPTPPPPTNSAPSVRILASGQIQPAGGSAQNFTASVGGEVSLDGASSTDSESDPLSYAWTLTSKPAISTVQLGAANVARVSFTPDAQGTYELSLRVTDSRGAFSDRAVSILVNNTAPLPVVLISAVYSVTPTVRPPQEITVGAIIVLDASNSTDPDGDPVTTQWSVVARPAGSAAGLTINGQVARFVADVAGTYQIMARGSDPLGAYSETIYVLEASNRAPNAVLVGSIITEPRDSGQTALQASVGYTVVLDGSASNDQDGHSFTRSWSMVSRPASSTAALSSANGSVTQFVPDVLGTYVVRLTITDSIGAAAVHTANVTVNNNRPVASIATNATPIALPTGPSVRVPVNTQLTLRGTGSQDADGDSITYAWSIVSAPTGSVAAIVAPASAITQFTPDVAGSYVLRLRVTDPAGAWSDRLLNIDIGNYPPVAVTDKNRITVVAGTSVQASAALSYDEDGDALTYAWAIDARPAGSSATIAAPNAAQLAFTPDVPGTYIVSVTVNDGGANGVTNVTVRALATIANSVPLQFAPLDARYSEGLDRLVVIAANPNSLRIVDPFVGGVQTVMLPVAVKAFSLSPDGTLAAVLHEGLVSLVDLTTAQLVRTTATAGSQTDVFVLNDATAYLIGQTGGQWVTPGITALNARTGASIALPPWTFGGARFYGHQRGVFAHRKNRVLFLAFGLSPADISSFDIDPVSHRVLRDGESPYHGDWPIGSRFFLSGNHDLLFTSAGNYFNSETLTYAGSLGIGSFLSMSHSSQADEALVLQNSFSGGGFPGNLVYNAQYRRFHGSLLLPDNDISLPQINGEQSYGIEIFHSANDDHIVLVQTGSDEALAPGVQYYVINR